MRFGSLFAGIGGFDLGLERAGMECVWQVEINPFCRKVLEKHWPNVRRYEDVRDVGIRNLEPVDLICGGFPCQDISNAGKRAGIEGERSGLWSEFHRIICELRPRYALVENVAALLVRGIGRVLGDLAASGYDAEWEIVSACQFGAPHSRERLFCLAYANEVGRRSRGNLSGPSSRFDHWKATQGKFQWGDMELWLRSFVPNCYGFSDPPELKRVDEWFPERLDRVGCVGNAVVPQVAEWIGRRIIDQVESH